jgi:aspartate aminotransferase
MPVSPVSRLSTELAAAVGPIEQFFNRSAWSRRAGSPGICDFVAGNPHEPVLPEFVDALVRAAAPQRNDWYAYKLNEPKPCGIVAEALSARHGMPFEGDDVFLVPGTFGGLTVTLRALVDSGDEVIFVLPPWFFYEAMILAVGATPVRVHAVPDSWDLDLQAINDAITPRTRAIVVNSPNNPTGRIYPPETMQALGRLLTEASERNGRAIYLLSDESYNRILFERRSFTTPTRYYDNSILLSTYTKILLTPGERVGYGALSPNMAEREAVRRAIYLAQLVSSFAFPSALLQHALGDLERMSIDIPALERKRDRMVEALRGIGYNLHVPEATFYLFPQAPGADDGAFTDYLAERDVFVLPGALVETPGYFRISLTATEDMIEHSLPVFEEAFKALMV